MSAILYVGGLPPGATSTDLERLFSRHGTVVRARVIQHEETNPTSLYGLVAMASETDALRALEAMTHYELQAHQLTVVHLKEDALGTMGLAPDL